MPAPKSLWRLQRPFAPGRRQREMPGPGEDPMETAPWHVHVQCRVTELLAGYVAERQAGYAAEGEANSQTRSWRGPMLARSANLPQ